MDHQHAVAQPERRDEDATEWAHRRFNTMPIAAAQTDTPQPILLRDVRDTLCSFPTGADLQHTSQSTSLATFQSYQQSAGFAGDSHVQQPDLPEEVQHELAEAEFRHTAARWDILERANARSTILHPKATTALYADAVTDETVTGYSGVYDRASFPVDSRQIPTRYPTPNDSSSVYELGPDVWPSQQISQTIVYPHISEDQVQCSRHLGIAFPNPQNYDPGAPYHAIHGQQLAVDLMPLTTSHGNTMINDQEDYGSFLEAPIERRHTQQLLPTQGVKPVPANASELLMHTAINPVYDMTALSAGLSWNRDINPSADHSLSTIMPELPSSSAIDQLAMTYFDVPGTTVSPVPSQVTKVAVKHCERQAPLVKRKQCISDSAGDSRTGSSCALDNIYFHTNPEDDRQRKKAQPKRRKVTRKASWSCFGCRLNKRRCEPSIDGLCVRCQNILNKNSYRTAVPKFTCDVRTKFSDMSIFTDIPPTKLSHMETLTDLLKHLPGPLKIDWDDGYPPLTLGGPGKPVLIAALFVIFRLVMRLHDFLDIMEPLHIRQHLLLNPNPHPVVFWSYLFSVARWKSAICFFWPDLEDVLDFHERFLRSYHQPLLAELDRMLSQGNNLDTAILLNIWYEAISAMEITPMVNIAAKEHLQSSLTHHLLHVYRRIFPATSTFEKSQQTELDYWISNLNMFPQTFEMLPQDYRFGPLAPVGRTLLRVHTSRAVSERRFSLGSKDAPSWKSPERLTNPYCATNAYIPARFLTVLGLDTETLNSSTSSQLMELVEAAIQEYLIKYDASFREEMLELAPWILSIALKAVLDPCITSNHTRAYKIGMLILSLRYPIEEYIYLMSMEVLPALGGTSKMPVSLMDIVMRNQILEPALIQVLADEYRGYEFQDHLESVLAIMYPEEPPQ